MKYKYRENNSCYGILATGIGTSQAENQTVNGYQQLFRYFHNGLKDCNGVDEYQTNLVLHTRQNPKL